MRPPTAGRTRWGGLCTMPVRAALRLSALLPLALAAATALPAEADPELAIDVKTLQLAQVATDGPGLLAYFREHTLTDERRARLTALVRQLGSDSFLLREKASQELEAAGRLALPFLRPAVGDRDLEVARRAERCLRAVE